MSSDTQAASRKGTGKIASLPHAVRSHINQRILDGVTYPEIADWANSLPDVQTILKERWSGVPISPQNLSEWKAAGYQKWLSRNDRALRIKNLSEYAIDLARAGDRTLSEGAAAIAAGRILETLETIADADDTDPETFDALIDSLTKLRSLDISKDRLHLDQRKADQKDRDLDLAEEKFQAQTVTMFLKWAGSTDAQRILNSGQPKHIQMDNLRELFFGKSAAES